MDDLYQYASAAVNSNTPNNNQASSEDNDIVLQAFSNFGWGQRFNNLLDTVRKQTEAFADATRKDFEELASVLRDDSATPTRDLSSSSSTVTANDRDDRFNFAALKERLSEISTRNLNSVRDGLSQAFSAGLPAQLVSSVRLPGNMDLERLRSEMAQGTQYAERYLQKFGSEVVQTLSKAVTVLEPESDEDDDNDQAVAGQRTATTTGDTRIFASRKEALLAKVRTDPDTYLKDPASTMTEDADKKVLETFNAGFNIEEYTDEIARLLDDYPETRNMMNELVPTQVSYKDFWQRYFYHVWKVEQDEQKRQLIVKGVEDDDEADFKWDSDEEEVNKSTEQRKPKATSDGKGSDTDFSNISEPVSTEASLVSPPLDSQADNEEWAKKKNEEDSDSDWE